MVLRLAKGDDIFKTLAFSSQEELAQTLPDLGFSHGVLISKSSDLENIISSSRNSRLKFGVGELKRNLFTKIRRNLLYFGNPQLTS